DPALVRVVGMHCESGDIVVDNEFLPGDVASGDLVAVAATGAYSAAMASNYNHVPRPPVVAVRDGRARVILRGETIDDLLARVALLGAGSVGSQVARLLLEHADELEERAGARLELAGIAVRDVDAPRDVELPRELLTTDAHELIVGSDIVIELMGGIEPARTH